MGKAFCLTMDRALLQWLNKTQSDNARLTQWALLLQPFKFSINFRPVETNKVADFFISVGIVGGDRYNTP